MKKERFDSRMSMVMYFLKGSMGYFVLFILFACLVSLLDLINPKIISYTVDTVLGDDPGTLPVLIENMLVPLGGAQWLKSNLWAVAVAVMVIALAGAVCRYFFQYLNGVGSEKLVHNMRNRLFDHILHLPFSWHSQNHTGDIIQRCTSDVETIKMFLSEQLTQLFRVIVLIGMALYFMFNMNVRLTLVVVAFIPVIVGYSLYFHTKIGDQFEKVDVEEGKLSGDLCYNEYGCGAVATKITLAPGESKTVAFVLGLEAGKKAESIIDRYADPAKTCAEEKAALIKFWHARFEAFQIKTPCKEFDTMINTWNAYNCFMTFTWSRAASFIYCGLRNGYGYRDTVQDIQGIIHLAPEMAAEKIRFMLSAQVDNGGGLPLVKFTHNAGHEDTPDDASYVKETGHPAYRADDAMWLFPTVYKYVAESGNLAFLDEVIPFANKDEGTVYEHLKRAIDFSMNHLGPHGMPAGLYADWNDCLRLGANGESSFVALQFYYAMTILREFAQFKKDDEYVAYLDENQKKLGDTIQKFCWNEDRFIRGYTEAGETIGERTAPEANMWLNPQSWSVISGFASEEQANLALDNVHEKLNTKYGAILMDPPYHAHAFDGALAVIYNAGVKENAGIFSQSQGWIILAEALMGHGERAFEYYIENSPAKQNEDADTRKLEPYCYGQFTEGKDSPHFGRSHVHWLTGTASTIMVGSVEGILGMRPNLEGLKIAPSIPKDWDGLEIEKVFRGKKLHITVKNPDHKESGCAELIVNGTKLEGNFVPESAMTAETDIVLTM